MDTIQVPYINNDNISISLESLKLNPYTWSINSVWEINVIELFNKELSASHNPIVIDIGAQSGSFTLLAKYHPTSQWYAFECDNTNFRLLKDNLSINNIHNCSAHLLGISDKKSNEILRRDPNHFGFHTLGTNVQRFKEDRASNIIVSTIDLDSFVNENNIPYISFIKIDTEGCELNILKGAKNTILNFKPKILLEFNDVNLQQFNYSKDQLCDFIVNELRYNIVGLYGENLYIVPRT